MRKSVLLLLCSLPLIAAQAARADGPSKAEQTRLFFGKDERIKVTDTTAQPGRPSARSKPPAAICVPPR